MITAAVNPVSNWHAVNYLFHDFLLQHALSSFKKYVVLKTNY